MSKLLIIDDSADLLDVLQLVLQHMGHSTETLIKATDIFEVVTRSQPNMMIIDIHLPWMDGREMCRQLKTNEATKHIPILLFSATPKDLTDYKKYYVDDFIEKPFDLRVLAEKIRNLLSSHSE